MIFSPVILVFIQLFQKDTSFFHGETQRFRVPTRFLPGVGILDAADIFESYFLDEPVLKHLVYSFHATFRLLAVGAYQFNPQVRQNPAKLRGACRGSTAIVHSKNARGLPSRLKSSRVAIV